MNAAAATVQHDRRIVMTLDAGGTNFRFTAVRGGQRVVSTVTMPACPDDLGQCVLRIIEGFRRVRTSCPQVPSAISFAFPGPADYPNGVIGDLGNLPCFRGGVPLGPILADEFGIPVFINNDGDLFAYGEAIGGLLPYVNRLLESAQNPKRYRNLLGVTLGTGFGGGIVCDGALMRGDNAVGAEIWLLRDKLQPGMNVEESVSIRGVRRAYAEIAGIAIEEAPDPEVIHHIACDRWMGNKAAAVAAYRRFGEAAGDAIANAVALVDGLVVIGGGLAGASTLFLPTVVAELNGEFTLPDGASIRRLAAEAFDLESDADRDVFLRPTTRSVEVCDWVNLPPRAVRTVPYEPCPRIGVGLTRLGTTEAIALGAYAFALDKLDT